MIDTMTKTEVREQYDRLKALLRDRLAAIPVEMGLADNAGFVAVFDNALAECEATLNESLTQLLANK